MQKWVKVRRTIIKSEYRPGHLGGVGLSWETHRKANYHLWLSCGHETDSGKQLKTAVCHHCSYREGEKPSNTASTRLGTGVAKNDNVDVAPSG